MLISMQNALAKLKSRYLTFTVAMIIVAYIGLNTVQVIVRNWQLQQEINKLRSEIAVLEAENERLTYDIEYYKTDEFLEQAARRKLNLKGPGEIVTVIPVADKASDNNSLGNFRPDEPPKSNWQSWMDFLFGRD